MNESPNEGICEGESAIDNSFRRILWEDRRKQDAVKRALSLRAGLKNTRRGSPFMNILVIDAQGGGIGRQVIPALKKACPEACVTAVGTNAMATAAMLKSGADHAATGENAVIVNSRRADVIIDPVGIVIADSLYGEVTPAMAVAVGQSSARRILIPVNHCDNVIVGVSDLNMARLIDEVVARVGHAAE